MRAGRRLALTFALLAASTSGCGGEQPTTTASPASSTAPAERPRLVLLYATCSVTCDYLSPYNDAVRYTPNLQRFADQGVVFRRHMTEAGQSGIAYASLFAGTDGRGHHVFSHPSKIPDSVYLVGEPYAELGYDVYFWGKHTMATAEYSYGQGAPPERSFDRRLTARDQDFRRVLRRLERDPEARAVLITTFSLTHSPYRLRNVPRFAREYPHEGPTSMSSQDFNKYVQLHTDNYKDLANNFPETIEKLGLSDAQVGELATVIETLYKANINLLDDEFGEMVGAIDAAGLRDDSLIVFTADHGESMYHEHRAFQWTHGWELSPEVLQVPWIMRAPASRPMASHFNGVTRSIDVFPTMAGLSGVPLDPAKAAGVTGVDLTAPLLGEEAEPELLAYAHTVVQHAKFLEKIKDATQWLKYHKGVNQGELWTAIRDRDWFYKYRNLDGENWGFQAFDLATDPFAKNDLFDESVPRHAEMKQALLEYRMELVESWQTEGAEPIFDEKAQAALRALGYIK